MPRKALGKLRVIISLPPELLKKLDQIAESTRRTRASVAEDAIAEYVARKPKR